MLHLPLVTETSLPNMQVTHARKTKDSHVHTLWAGKVGPSFFGTCVKLGTKPSPLPSLLAYRKHTPRSFLRKTDACFTDVRKVSKLKS